MPRISINQLADYLNADGLTRKRIVSQAKKPSKVIVARYRDARATINEYFRTGYNDQVVNDMLIDLDGRTPSSDWWESDIRCSFECLELLLEAQPPDLDGVEVEIFGGENRLINIEGVDISVNPDLVLREERNGINYFGAIKTHIRQTPLEEESQRIVAMMVEMFVQREFATGDDMQVDKSLCISFDAYGKSFIESPAATVQRMRRVEAVCQEIALWWDTL